MNKKLSKKPFKKMPAAFSRPVQKTNPVQRMTRDGSILLTNEEYIADLTGVNTFTPVSFAVNPGLVSTFPWLSNVANNYEFYTFQSLRFEFRTTVGTTNSGSVAMAMDYDAADVAPTTRAKMLSYDGAVSGPVFSPLTLECPKSHMIKMAVQRYTRGGAVPSGKDVKTYDLGNLYVSTICATAAVGQLFVRYTVKLQVPHSPDSYPWQDSAYVSTATATKAAPYTGATFTNADTADPLIVSRDASSFIIKRAGEYLIDQVFTGTGLTGTAFTGLNALTQAASDPAPSVTDYTNLLQGTAALQAVAKVKTYGNDTILTTTSPGGWTTVTGASVKIAPYSYAL